MLVINKFKQLLLPATQMIAILFGFMFLRLWCRGNSLEDCNFKTLENAILNPFVPYEEMEFASPTQGTQALAFWSQHLPYNQIRDSFFLGGEANKNYNAEGRRLFFFIKLKQTAEILLIYQQNLPLASPELKHQIFVKSGDLMISEILELQTYFYEGQWILHYFFWDEFSMRVQVAGEHQPLIERQVNSVALPKDILIATLGGYGQLQFGAELLSFTFFTGRLSRLIVQNNSSIFSDKESLLNAFRTSSCSVPNECAQIKSHLLIDKMLLDGDDQFSTSIKQIGKNYIIGLWSKPNFSKLKVGTQMFLLRITLNENYSDATKLGDRSIHIKYNVNFLQKWSSLCASAYHYKIPEKDGEGQTDHEVCFGNPAWTHQALQDWHYLSFYQNVDLPPLDQKYRQFFTVQFQRVELLGVCNFGEIGENDQFSNTQMYIHLGSDNYFFQQKFLGQISKFKIQFCNPTLTYSYPDCHYSCSTSSCYGPEFNDCGFCQPEHNRVIIQEQNICECKLGFVEVINDPICDRFENQYPTVKIAEIQSQISKKMRQGKYYINSIEFDCPQLKRDNLYCLECMRQPLTWYIRPVCQSDYIRTNLQSFSPFVKIERKVEDFDVFLISEDLSLYLCAGCQEFCNEGDESCFLSNHLHLGQRVYIKCKANSIFVDGYCQKCLLNCQECTSSGECKRCTRGYYFNPDEQRCLICPSPCQECFLDSSKKQLTCTVCPSFYSLYSGGCWKCGVYCEYCEYTRISSTSLEMINRCYKCIDQSAYFISFDGINCLPNIIQKCLYAFQYNKNNRSLSTLDYEFVPQPLDDNIITACAQCELGLVYTMSDNTCSNYYGTQILGEYFYRENSSELPVCLSCFNTKFAQQMIGTCFQNNFKIENCRQCLFSNTYKIWKCSGCLTGYYSSRFDGKCIPCPSSCLLCLQQMKKSRDSYIYNIKPFYEFFVNFDGQRDFELYGQSQDLNDYEIICSACPVGFELYEGQCIEPCSKLCKKCEKINGKNVCQQCLISQQGQILSVHNGSCILCPQNCALCEILSEAEIKLINPYFNNPSFSHYSHYCLASFPQEQFSSKLFYDVEIGKIVSCYENEICEVGMEIQKRVYCNSDQYELELSKIPLDKERQIFRQKNSKFSTLFSPDLTRHFTEFENEVFYKELNQRHVKRLAITLDFHQQQVCALEKPGIINQLFSQNVFSSVDVKLIVLGHGSSILLHSNLTIANFTSISFSNMNIVIQHTEFANFLVFDQLKPVEVIFSTVNINQQLKKQPFILIFKNLRNCTFFDVLFNQLYQQNIDSFIQILSTQVGAQNKQIQEEKQLQMTRVRLVGSHFIKSNFLSIQQFAVHLKEFLTTNSTFIQSSLLSINQLAQFQITSIRLQHLNLDLSLLIISNNLEQLIINDLIIEDSLFQTSQLLNFSSNIFVSNAKMQYLELSGISSLFCLKPLTLDTIGAYLKFENLFFYKITYSTESKLMILQSGQIYGVGLIIRDLILKPLLTSSVLPKMTDALIYINMSSVQLYDITLYRSFGFPDITLINTEYVELKRISIIQLSENKAKGLHQYVDCVQRQVNLTYQVTAVFIYQFNKIIIESLNVQNIIIADYQLIQIFQNSIRLSNFSINLINAQIEENLLLLFSEKSQASIFHVTSNSPGFIRLQKLKLISNHGHSYVQDNNLESTCLIKISAVLATVSMEEVQLSRNLNTNTTNTLLHIQAKTLQLQKVIFDSNNLFLSEIILKNLIWRASEIIELLDENLEETFPINSLSGCCLFSVSSLFSNELTIVNSQGSKGGCMHLNLIQEATILIQNSVFANISKFFTSSENGGCIFLKHQASNAVITFKNNTFDNIFAKKLGGVLYIQPSQFASVINVEWCNFTDVEARSGAVLHIEHYNSSIYSQISFSQVEILSSQTGFKDFLSSFEQFERNEQQEFLQSRQMFYLTHSDLLITKTNIVGLTHSSLVQGLEIKLKMENVRVIDGIAQRYLIQVQSSQAFLSRQTFTDLFIQHLSFNRDLDPTLTCNPHLIQNAPLNMQCSNENNMKVIPKSKKLKVDTYYHFVGQCNLFKFQQLMASSSVPVGVIQLSSQLDSMISFRNLQLLNINCDQCSSGLIMLTTQSYFLNVSMYSTNLRNNICGLRGCLNFKWQAKRVLTEVDAGIELLEIPVLVKNMICSDNFAQYGGCMNLESTKIAAFDSEFSSNSAKIGGAIYLDENSEIYLVRCLVKGNHGEQSTSIFRSNGEMSFTNLWRLEPELGDDIPVVQSPIRLAVRTNAKSSLLQSVNVLETVEEKVDKIISSPFDEIIYFPNGQRLGEYQFYNQSDDSYYYQNFTFQIYALDNFGNIQVNLEKTSCALTPFVNEALKPEIISIQNVTFSQVKQCYDLDQLVFYLNPFNNETLSLYIQCDSIKIPIKNNSQPHNLIGYHNNYKLLVKIKTLPCQIGEIWDNASNSCQLCDATKQQYSVNANATKCEQIDEDFVQNLTAAQLQLRPYHWRPYKNNDQIQYCINLPLNCLGGWDVGDDSCFIGHIGALCEQCDLYNIRGTGQFAQSELFSCGECSSIQQNIIVILAVSLWTLISISITVYTGEQVLHGLRKLWRCPNVAVLIANRDGIQAILIKCLLNYFQIVGSLNQFQLQFPDTFNKIFNYLGNPIKNVVFSLDCFLIDSSSLEILYIRIIWQLAMPFAYLVIFCLLYKLFDIISSFQQKISHIVTATIYIFIYFQPHIIEALISLISFRQISGIKWVQGHVAYQYNTQSHEQWVIYLGAILAIFSLFLPLYFLWQLTELKNRLKLLKVRAKYGYLYNEYKIEAYYWEIVKILLKECIIIVLIFYQDQIFLKAILIFFLLQAYIKLQNSIKPYNLIQLNQLDILSNQVCSYSMIFGFGIFMSQQSRIQETQIPFLMILIASNGYFLIEVLHQLLNAFLRKYEVWIDRLKKLISKQIPIIQGRSKICAKLFVPRLEKRLQVRKKFWSHIQIVIQSNRSVKKSSEQRAFSKNQYDTCQEENYNPLSPQNRLTGSGKTQVGLLQQENQ